MRCTSLDVPSQPDGPILWWHTIRYFRVADIPESQISSRRWGTEILEPLLHSIFSYSVGKKRETKERKKEKKRKKKEPRSLAITPHLGWIHHFLMNPILAAVPDPRPVTTRYEGYGEKKHCHDVPDPCACLVQNMLDQLPNNVPRGAFKRASQRARLWGSG